MRGSIQRQLILSNEKIGYRLHNQPCADTSIENENTERKAAMANETSLNIVEDRPRKRRREGWNRKFVHATTDHRLFVPFRALGLITNHIPFHLQTRSHKGATEGPRVHILTCLGRSWALWEGGKMTLLFVGEPFPT